MIVAMLMAAIATGAGTVATYRFDGRSSGIARLATGAAVGLTGLGIVAFAFAMVAGLGAATLTGSAVVLSLASLLLAEPRTRRAIRHDLQAVLARLRRPVRRPTRSSLLTAVYVGYFAVGLWFVADRNLFETADGLYITNVGNLGDLPFHAAVTASFAYGDNFPPQNPVAAGIPFSYYYMVDFIAAIFVASGATLREGMLLVSLILGASLLALVYRWARDLTGSVSVARLAPILLVFSGGLGWVLLFVDSAHSEDGLIQTFVDTTTRYTIQSDGILRFQNAVTGFLIPQRGILLGMSLGLITLTLLGQQLRYDGAKARADLDQGPADRSTSGSAHRDARMLVAGILTGIMPIVHLHTFGVVVGTAFLHGLLFRQWRDGQWRRWLVYVAAAAAVGGPVLLWTARGSTSIVASYFSVQLGWEMGSNGFLVFWLANTGLFIPLLLLAFLWPGKRHLLSRRLVVYVLPFMGWFLVANLFRLAPWPWDNIKVLAYWWLGGIPVIGLLLVRLWDYGGWRQAGSVLATVVLVGAGALDVARVTVGPRTYLEWTTAGVAFADAVRQHTPPDAIILADPTWNTPILLTGRPLYMGYDGWLFAHGLPYAERAAATRAMYAGGENAADLLLANGISYIALGPQERADVSPNESFLSRFPVVVEMGEYRLYRVLGP